MTSDKQIKANRRNALKSTGPKTEDGKAVVSLNALRHGLRSEKALLLPGEDAEVLDELRERIQADLQPVGELENILVEQITAAVWRLRRINQIETGILAWEYYGIQENRAKYEARQYERTARSPILTPPVVVVIDERSHEVALREARRAREIQESEIPTLGLAFTKKQDAFSKLGRYQATVERSFFKALSELKRLQSERKGRDPGEG